MIDEAKAEAAKRGKSLSQMVSDFFASLSKKPAIEDEDLPPITRSLCGIIKNSPVDESDYKKHLEEKYS